MTPSIEVRLESVLHGLRDVIFPAIKPGEALALDLDFAELLHVRVLPKQVVLIGLEYEVAVIFVVEFVFECPVTRGPRNFAGAKFLGEIFEVAFHLKHFNSLSQMRLALIIRNIQAGIICQIRRPRARRSSFWNSQYPSARPEFSRKSP